MSVRVLAHAHAQRTRVTRASARGGARSPRSISFERRSTSCVGGAAPGMTVARRERRRRPARPAGGACSPRSVGSRIAAGDRPGLGSWRSSPAWAATRLPHELKGGGFTNPRPPPSRAGARCRSACSFGPASLDHRLHERRRSPRAARPSRRRWRRPSPGVTPRTVPGLRTVQTYATTGDASSSPATARRRSPCSCSTASSEQVQAQIPTIRASLRAERADAPTSPATPPCTQARATSRPGPAQGRELHHPRSRSSCSCSSSGRWWPPPCRSSAAAWPCHGHPGRFWPARPALRHLRLRDERGDAARPCRGHRLRAVHGRPVPRGAGRRPHRGRGRRDDGRPPPAAPSSSAASPWSSACSASCHSATCRCARWGSAARSSCSSACSPRSRCCRRCSGCSGHRVDSLRVAGAQGAGESRSGAAGPTG